MPDSTGVIHDFQSAIKERIDSPLTGVFILSWLLTNWHVPVILTFGTTTPDRVLALEKYFASERIWIYTVAVPLVITVAYAAGMPRLKAWYERWLATLIFANKKHELTLQLNLNELTNYRSTLLAMNGFLRDETVKDLNLVQTLIAQFDRIKLDNSTAATVVKENEAHLHQALQRLKKTTTEMNDFNSQYPDGGIESLSRPFLQRTGRRRSST